MADGRELVIDGTARPPHGSGIGVLAVKVGQVVGDGCRAVGVAMLEGCGFRYLVHPQCLHPLAVNAWQGNGNRVNFLCISGKPSLV